MFSLFFGTHEKIDNTETVKGTTFILYAKKGFQGKRMIKIHLQETICSQH